MTELQYLDKIATCAQVSMIALIVIAVLVLIATQSLLNITKDKDKHEDKRDDEK